MKKSNLWSIVVVAVLIVGIVLGVALTQKRAPAHDITVAAALPLTGPLAFFGGPEKVALEMAIEDANAKGGANDQTVKLVLEDSKGSAKDGVSALQKLLLVKPTAVITSLTIVSTATQPILTQAGVPQIALSVHPTIVKGSELTFRPYYGFEDEMRVIASYLESKRAKRVALLWVKVPECEEAIGTVLKPALTRQGAAIVASETYSLADTNVRSQLTKVAGAAPDAIYVLDFGTLMGSILKDAQTLGVRQKIVGGIGLFTAPPIAPKLLEGLPFAGPTFAIAGSGSYEAFAERFKQRAKTEANYDVTYTYDAMMMLIDAIRRVGTEPQVLVKGLRGSGEYAGVSGKMTVLADGNVTTEVSMGQYRDGKMQPLAAQ